jgi:membrane dipeptidase
MGVNGSVMGITGIRMFVHRQDPTTIENVIDHFSHVVRVAGIEHVGVGSDAALEGRDQEHGRHRSHLDISGLNHPKRMFDLTEGLIRRRFSNRNIELILGGNFQRVLSSIIGA